MKMENNKNQNKHFGNEISLKKFERTHKELVYELNWKRVIFFFYFLLKIITFFFFYFSILFYKAFSNQV